MFKFVLSAIILIIALMGGSAQNVAINNTGASAHTSAILDVSSENKGILIPRLPTGERQGIVDPAEGLLVYDINTSSFWFFAADNWHEIPNSTGMSGPAGGDLSGNFPAPNVIKLQNRNVDAALPANRHVLKWDAPNNTWKGMKDSLSLPLIATDTYVGSLFSLNNLDGSAGSSALKGKINSGSGITPSISMGVWGDNANGLGVVGTSNVGIGMYGLSFQNHGVYGYSVGENFAGVSGSHASAHGIAVMGAMSEDGTGILGSMTGEGGIAGLFQSTYELHTDTTLKATTAGTGVLGSFEITNATSPNPAVAITTQGIGSGLVVSTTNAENESNAVDVTTDGTTTGLNVNTLLGKAAVFTTSSPEAPNDAVQVYNYGTRNAATIKTMHTSTSQPALSVEHKGLGHSLLVYSSNASSNHAAGKIISEGNRGLEVSSEGQLGILSYAGGDQGVAVHGFTSQDAVESIGVKGESGFNGENGIGVFGKGGTNDPGAIGVKGINATNGEAVGAVTGINNGTGVGVYGASTGVNGIGVLGVGGTGNIESKAALFKNIYANNTKEVVSVTSTGKGTNLYLLNTNLLNATPLLRIKNAGTGHFLSLESNLGDTKTSISKDGHIATDGTLSVREGKGIIRNSNGTQLRYEKLTTPVFTSIDEDDYELIESYTLQFSEAFSEPPMVMVAGINSYYGYHNFFLNLVVFDITTTECKVYIVNPTSNNTGSIEISWDLVAIGPE